jgi:S-adenosylmethionine decarboxylase
MADSLSSGDSHKFKSVTDPVSAIAVVGQVSFARPSGFEGPEKRLEVIVRGDAALAAGGFRQAERATWDAIIGVLNAKIVNHVANDSLDAYVLTESSLFVYPHKLILITCGTTVLLKALDPILELVAKLEMEVEWASFMRKNFTYPWEQIGPHATMETEYSYLKKYFPKGAPFIFGPIDSDHYFAFVFDDMIRPCVEDDTQVSMTMYDMDPEVAKHFYSDKFLDGPDTDPIREATKLNTLVCDGWTVQDLQFEPCGYSINAIRGDAYQTMHITPEAHCSFASYETNMPVSNVAEQLNKVLKVFSPQRFSVLILADPQCPLGLGIAKAADLGLGSITGYSTSNIGMNEFAPGYTLVKANFTRDPPSRVNSQDMTAAGH